MAGGDPAERGDAGRAAELAEFSALRAEIDRRANVQWNVYALQIGSAGGVGAVAIGSPSLIALLLLIPMSSYMLGMRYVLHDFHIRLINEYVRDSLSPRLDNGLHWEQWKGERLAAAVRSPRWFTAAGWNVTHPTRLAFVGVAMLAELAAVIGGLAERASHDVSVWVVICYILAAAIDLVAIAGLDVAFRKGS